MTLIAVAHNYGMSEDAENAFKYLKIAEEEFTKMTNNESVRTLGPAYLHVLKATEVFLLKERGYIDRALEVTVNQQAIRKKKLRNTSHRLFCL